MLTTIMLNASDGDDECFVMRVLQETADPLPVRHDADVRWQGRQFAELVSH